VEKRRRRMGMAATASLDLERDGRKERRSEKFGFGD